MRILMINKFLYPNGGSETYVLGLGEFLEKQGHEVQYFGMEHTGRCVGNRVGAYTSDMDFHGAGKREQLMYALKTIYSAEARKKIRQVLDDFKPNICHLNNFNYQLTPSIILEIRKWEKETRNPCGIVFTAHDYNLLCPNHLMHDPNTGANCEKCLGGHFLNCIKGRCIHGSRAKSVIGTAEAFVWNAVGVYRNIDRIICCSQFLKHKMDTNPALASKTVALHNFVEDLYPRQEKKQDYVLYFGRFSKEKGTETLLEACRELPHIPFVFAGKGPLEDMVNAVPNVRNVGFQTGEALKKLVAQARFSVCPSECYENCPFSVMESQVLGTPVLGADIGGIPELVQQGVTGELFESGNAVSLADHIQKLWEDASLTERYSQNCQKVHFDSIDEYTRKLMEIYHAAGA